MSTADAAPEERKKIGTAVPASAAPTDSAFVVVVGIEVFVAAGVPGMPRAAHSQCSEVAAGRCAPHHRLYRRRPPRDVAAGV